MSSSCVQSDADDQTTIEKGKGSDPVEEYCNSVSQDADTDAAQSWIENEPVEETNGRRITEGTNQTLCNISTYNIHIFNIYINMQYSVLNYKVDIIRFRKSCRYNRQFNNRIGHINRTTDNIGITRSAVGTSRRDVGSTKSAAH